MSCAVALSVIDVIKKEGLRENATKVGNHIMLKLESMKTRHPLIGDVRYNNISVLVKRDIPKSLLLTCCL